MSEIKKLAGQTIWYGASSIAARFLNYLLTPYLTATLLTPAYGEMSLVYALIPFLNIIFTYGLETAYFRYVQKKEQDVYNTITVSLIISTISFTLLMLLMRHSLAGLISIKNHPEYITWSAFIIALDTLTTISFARLRHENRPVKYATIRIVSILINIGITVFFLSVCPSIAAKNPNSPYLFYMIRISGSVMLSSRTSCRRLLPSCYYQNNFSLSDGNLMALCGKRSCCILCP